MFERGEKVKDIRKEITEMKKDIKQLKRDIDRIESAGIRDNNEVQKLRRRVTGLVRNLSDRLDVREYLLDGE